MKFDKEKVIEESSDAETSGTDGDNENESDVESEDNSEDLPQKFDLTKLNERLEDGPPSCSESEEEEDEDSDLEEDEFDNDSDAENNDDKDKEKDENDTEEKNSGWADAMAKVFATGKNIESNKPLLLSKAKKDVGTVGETTEEGKVLEKASVRRAKKKEWEELARKRPDIVKDRQKEKKLARIATRGVVQLFNAVREQQKTLKTQLDKAGLSTTKRDKVFKNLDKGAFLEVLSGKRPSSQNKKTDNDNSVTKRAKVEIKDEEEDDGANWSALKDNFMMGAKMRDWDKENSDSD